MIEVREFRVGDAEGLYENCIDDIVSKVPEILLRKEAEREEKSCAFTGLIDGEIIGAAGIFIRRENVGDVWLLVSKKVQRHKLSSFRCLKRMLGILIDKFELKKLRSESRKGFTESQRLLEHLGFIKQRRELIRGDMFGNAYYLYIKEV